MSRLSDHVMNWRNRTKQKLVDYKGGKCSRCGYDKRIPAAYDFHHVNPDEKDFNISGKSWSYEKLKSEVDKCMLVCKNCHAEIHFEQTDDKRRQRLLLQMVPIPKRCCDCCRSEFKPTNRASKYCSLKCARQVQKRFDVSKETLEKLTQEKPYEEIGRIYNVSGGAVKKRCKVLGIETPPRRGYWSKVVRGIS